MDDIIFSAGVLGAPQRRGPDLGGQVPVHPRPPLQDRARPAVAGVAARDPGGALRGRGALRVPGQHLSHPQGDRLPHRRR